MPDIKAALAMRGYSWKQLPPDHPDRPIANAKRAGNLVTVSGQVPIHAGSVITGKVGDDVDVDRAYFAAELCALYCLYAAGSIVNPDSIVDVFSMTVYVNGAPGFTDTSDVADGASDFFVSVLGEEAGRCARAAVGVAELPKDAAVEITVVFVVQ